jgi:hypothetical protein
MTLFERQNASVNKFALTLKDFYTVGPTSRMKAQSRGAHALPLLGAKPQEDNLDVAHLAPLEGDGNSLPTRLGAELARCLVTIQSLEGGFS